MPDDQMIEEEFLPVDDNALAAAKAAADATIWDKGHEKWLRVALGSYGEEAGKSFVLTPDEQEAMDATVVVANTMRRIIGDGPCASGDWAECARIIHDLQCRIFTQVAARAGLCRPLGGSR